DHQRQCPQRRWQQRRPADGTRRHPRRGARRHLAGWRPVHRGRHTHRRTDHPDADLGDLCLGPAAAGEPRGQGGAGVRGNAAAIEGIPRLPAWPHRSAGEEPMSGAVSSSVQAGDPRVRARREPRRRPLAITLMLFVAMAAAGSILYPGFLAPQVFLNLLIDNSFLCIVAVGMTFVILTGGIDLSVGAVIALTTMLLASLVQARVSPLIAVPLVLLVGALFGLLHGVLIQRFRLQPFIVTLAGMFLARGLSYLVSTESISIDDPVIRHLATLRVPLGVGSLTIGALVALGVVVAGMWIAHAPPFGRTVYAVGGDA